MKRAPYDPLLFPRLVIWTLLFSVLTITTADPDLWGHVRFGLDILRDRTIATIDSYSFTSDREWINHEWLAEVTMGAAFGLGGSLGLSLLKLLVMGWAFLMVARELRLRGVHALSLDLLLVAAVIGCLALTKTVRPQMFSILMFVWLLRSLTGASDGQLRRLVVVPVLFAAWANLHGGWIVGLGVLGLWASVDSVSAGSQRPMWMAAVLAAALATLLTPYGIDLWRFLWATVGLGRADISEWQSAPARGLSFVLLWAAPTAVAVASVRRMTPSWPAIAVVLALGLLSFKVVRLIPFFMIATVMLMGPVWREPRRRATDPTGGTLAVSVAALFAVVALGIGGEVARRNLACIDSEQAWVPDWPAAMAMRQAGVSGRLLLPFDWGEYAIWHVSPKLRVSIDGRRETVYTEATFTRNDAILAGSTGWQESLRELAPDAIWVPKDAAIVADLRDSGWFPVVETPRSVVFARQPGVVQMAPDALPRRCFPN